MTIVEEIDHITINVKNMNQSINFYGSVLGLKRLPDIIMQDHRLVYFQIGKIRLELIEYFFETSNSMDELLNKGKLRHLAFRTYDINRVWEKIKKTDDVVVLQEPKWNDTLQFTGMLVLDPNGCELEFVQR